jgi:hypothetical protein
MALVDDGERGAACAGSEELRGIADPLVPRIDVRSRRRGVGRRRSDREGRQQG